MCHDYTLRQTKSDDEQEGVYNDMHAAVDLDSRPLWFYQLLSASHVTFHIINNTSGSDKAQAIFVKFKIYPLCLKIGIVFGQLNKFVSDRAYFEFDLHICLIIAFDLTFKDKTEITFVIATV